MVKPMARMEIMPRAGMVGGGGGEDVESERTLLAATGTSVLLRKKHGGAAAAAMTRCRHPLRPYYQVRLRPVQYFGLLSCLSNCKLQSLPQPPLPMITGSVGGGGESTSHPACAVFSVFDSTSGFISPVTVTMYVSRHTQDSCPQSGWVTLVFFFLWPCWSSIELL